jgi:adenylyl-sulfate kinase
LVIANDHLPITDMEHKGFTIWFTGLSGAGKSTLARLIAAELRARGMKVEVLDGDVVRTHLSKGLGFSKEDRDTNIRRIGWVCEVLSRNQVVAIAAAISPYRAVRDEIRAKIADFVEVHVDCPIGALAERDVKGLYRKALAGEIKNFTGIDDPYEPPLQPEVTCYTDERETPQESAQRILAKLGELGLLPDSDSLPHRHKEHAAAR